MNFAHVLVLYFVQSYIAKIDEIWQNCSIIKNGFGKTALYEAAENGHAEIFKIILDMFEEKNPEDIYGQTPLHLAAQNGHAEIFKMILDVVEDKTQ